MAKRGWGRKREGKGGREEEEERVSGGDSEL